MNKYKTIIIGLGGQGCLADGLGSGNEDKIISFANAIIKHDGFELVGGCDIDQDKRNNAERYWGMKTFNSFIDCDKHFDVAVVATSDNCHFEILKQLVDYRPKLILCEKPICTDLKQAREIVELYKAKEIPILVNYTRNFLPYYEDLKQRYNSGEFGKIVSANVVFNRGWKHTATHAISFLEWFFDGQYNGKIMECETDYRIWQMDLFFEKYHWREERIGDMPVWDYYDKSHWHVVNNAFQFLEGKEELKCTGEQALRSLEICFELMENG